MASDGINTITAALLHGMTPVVAVAVDGTGLHWRDRDDEYSKERWRSLVQCAQDFCATHEMPRCDICGEEFASVVCQDVRLCRQCAVTTMDDIAAEASKSYDTGYRRAWAVAINEKQKTQ